MRPWKTLATTTAPDGSLLRLFRRGDEISIRLADGNELMNSRLGGSEEALAALALDGIGPAPRILIGGLGMGFTLRAAQARAPDARIVVAELLPDLVDWARGPMAEVFGDSLDRPGTDIRTGDVAHEIARAPAAWDAILLDVDNGPDGLTVAANGGLYDARGLAAAHRALSPGGVLAVWSAAPDPGFTRRLSRAGFDVAAHSVRAGRSGRGSRHTVWTARRV